MTESGSAYLTESLPFTTFTTLAPSRAELTKLAAPRSNSLLCFYSLAVTAS